MKNFFRLSNWFGFGGHGAKSGGSRTPRRSNGRKEGKKNKLGNFRSRLTFEPLEERTLLAVTWEVNTTADVAADTWDPTDNIVSLREAIVRAETGDTIHFAESLAGGTITLSGTQLEINKSLTIDASALEGGIIINANQLSRVFNVTGGTADAPVELINLTVTGGHVIAAHGGGIYNSGRLFLTNCTISCNYVEMESEEDPDTIPFLDYGGGGIYNSGSLTITNSQICGNSVFRSYSLIIGSSTMADGSGGGIYNSCGTLKLINSTVSGNSAKTGGGIYYFDFSSSLFGSATSLSIYNTIVAMNTESDVYVNDGIINAYNSLSSYTKWSTSENTLVYDSSKPLFTDADNGDYTLCKDSQAIDVGKNTYAVNPDGTAIATDLAGKTRIVNGVVDLGAYEFQKTDLPTVSLVVDTLADTVDANDGVTSLREAIAHAATGDSITFAKSLAGGTITLSGTQLEIDKSLTIDASAFYNAETNIPGITINADQKSRVFYANAGMVQLIGLTITGGKDSGSKKTGGSGGGIYNSGHLMITYSTISGNTVSGSFSSGGGIYNYQGTLTMTRCTVSGNSASSGGGINNYYGGLTITYSTISENSASSGGGISGYDGLTITNSTISGNTASTYGGGIYNSSGLITNCTISGNVADYGGGIYGGGLAITNSTISGNTASAFNGGGIYYYYYNTTLTLKNSIVVLNMATSSGNDIYQDVLNAQTGIINASNVLSSYIAWTTSETCYVYDSSKPLYTNAADGDYTLCKGSQAIDVGNNTYAVNSDGTAIATDLAGEARIVNGVVDLGAYEYASKEYMLYQLVQEGCSLYLCASDFMDTSELDENAQFLWDLSGSNIEDTSNFDPTKGAAFWISVEELGFAPGDHIIRLKVQDGETPSKIFEAMIRVIAVPPIVYVTKSDYADGQVLLLSLDVFSSGFRTVKEWTINWGDGNASVIDSCANALKAAHYYTQGDADQTYTVTLNLLDTGNFGANSTYVIANHTVTGSGQINSLAAEKELSSEESQAVCVVIKEKEDEIPDSLRDTIGPLPPFDLPALKNTTIVDPIAAALLGDNARNNPLGKSQRESRQPILPAGIPDGPARNVQSLALEELLFEGEDSTRWNERLDLEHSETDSQNENSRKDSPFDSWDDMLAFS